MLITEIRQVLETVIIRLSGLNQADLLKMYTKHIDCVAEIIYLTFLIIKINLLGYKNEIHSMF